MILGNHIENDEIFSTKLKVIQIFIKNNFKFSPSDLSKEYKDRYFFIHSSLFNNLSCEENFNKYIKSNLVKELKISNYFKNSGVVIHPGTCTENKLIRPLKDTLQVIIKNIIKLYNNNSDLGTLLLENCAHEGKKVPSYLDEFSFIFKCLEHYDKKILDKVGICIDTCHLFAAGEFDISKCKEVIRFKKEFDEKIGLKYLKLIHLNDSKCLFDSHRDRHETLGEGYIWKDNKEALLFFIKEFKDLPFVCEHINFEKSKKFILN